MNRRAGEKAILPACSRSRFSALRSRVDLRMGELASSVMPSFWIFDKESSYCQSCRIHLLNKVGLEAVPI
jgi:hypothetical protein